MRGVLKSRAIPLRSLWALFLVASVGLSGCSSRQEGAEGRQEKRTSQTTPSKLAAEQLDEDPCVLFDKAEIEGILGSKLGEAKAQINMPNTPVQIAGLKKNCIATTADGTVVSYGVATGFAEDSLEKYRQQVTDFYKGSEHFAPPPQDLERVGDKALWFNGGGGRSLGQLLAVKGDQLLVLTVAILGGDPFAEKGQRVLEVSKKMAASALPRLSGGAGGPGEAEPDV